MVVLTKSSSCVRYGTGSVCDEQGLVRMIAFFKRKTLAFSKRQDKNLSGNVFRWLVCVYFSSTKLCGKESFGHLLLGTRAGSWGFDGDLGGGK